MALQIIRANDAIKVDHPVILIIGDPGIGKTTLGFTADAPLLLDFDSGSYRAQNRRDVLGIDGWKDAQALLDPVNAAELEPYKTLVVDTVGRALDQLALHLMASDAKAGRAGVLSLQGWGQLKGAFKGWLSAARALKKDVILLAHATEKDDGQVTRIKADIPGGTYSEVMKLSDAVGYFTIGANGARSLDFNPTERWVGKNPAVWAPIEIQHYAKDAHLAARLVAEVKASLNKMGEESAKASLVVDAWRAEIEEVEDAEKLSAMIPGIKALKPQAIMAQVRAILMERGEALGLAFDKKTLAFVPK
jgi:phage nucleotide-binding protein